MDRRDLADLLVLQIVGESGSFTRAAAILGRSQSGVSQSIRSLETRIGVPLLNRSTRSVSLTPVGQGLLQRVNPALREIAEGIRDAAASAETVSGTLRLTMTEYPARRIIAPILRDFLDLHPRITVDIHVGDRLEDIVSGGFDAGIRFGPHLENDMIAVPLGSDVKAAIVASPAYLANRKPPQTLADLRDHDCINYRTATHGDLFRWRLWQDGQAIDVPVTGRLLVNDARLMIEAAVMGLGLGYTFEPFVTDELADGRLIRCLEASSPLWPGYALYYPGRNQKSAALNALIEHLRRLKRLK